MGLTLMDFFSSESHVHANNVNIVSQQLLAYTFKPI